ncbi:Hypothetical Protein FCC1311_050482 [Hondaea fermentalgiana]|uniref:Uncharacterized protein n=1 Tax=Hondaea fermentalgiana TaxID=2315210 RepID=A0A2R5GCX9_9STRA|nr:Hypothetical Protein FCC1311_050482 [Hondaea fermentalgiana]|eukprot:GBG28827.1 Hypothetical Protein FCC1311_050482 [Hondaea fermentalgiana]
MAHAGSPKPTAVTTATETAVEARENGNALLRKGDVAGAIAAYEAAKKLDESCHLTLSNLSLAQLQAGDAAQATQSALTCLQHAPEDFVKGWLRLARAAHAFGDQSLAEKALRSALARCDEKAQQAHVLAVAKALKIENIDPDPEVQSAFLAWRRAQDAKGNAEVQVKEARSSVSADEVADLHRKEKEFEEALQAAAAAATAAAASSSATTDSSATGPIPLDSNANASPLSTFQVMLDARKASDQADMLLVDYEVAGSLGRQGPVPAPDRSGDFLGLYEVEQTNPEEYWNMETGFDPSTRSGMVRMKRPRKAGNYEFRYMTDGGRRCAGRSQGIIVFPAPAFTVCIVHKDSPPPFMLLKEPNLLCYWLYMPLTQLPSDDPRKSVSLSGTHLPAKLMTATPDPRIPTMTIDEKIHVRILAPAKARVLDGTGTPTSHLVPYLNLSVDEQIDLERSTLSFHNGDFLAARLAFSNMFTAANARQQRMLLHPAPIEHEAEAYKEGIQCRGCGAKLTGSLERVNQSPLMPWTEMLEHLTCVPPESYISSDPHGTARPFRTEAMTARPGIVLLDDAHIDVCHDDLQPEALQLCQELKQVKEALDDASRAQDHLVRRAIECAACSAWLGDAVVPDHTERESLVGVQEARFIKHCVQTKTTPVFNTYTDCAGSTVGARLARLSETHQVRTVLVRICEASGGKERHPMRVQLWTADSWIRTPASGTDMVPVLKVTYRTQRVEEGVDAHFGILHLTHRHYDELAHALSTSNAWLPPSARVIREDVDERFGFLFW